MKESSKTNVNRDVSDKKLSYFLVKDDPSTHEKYGSKFGSSHTKGKAIGHTVKVTSPVDQKVTLSFYEWEQRNYAYK